MARELLLAQIRGVARKANISLLFFAQELHADIPNYTDIEPIIQLSEVIEL